MPRGQIKASNVDPIYRSTEQEDAKVAPGRLLLLYSSIRRHTLRITRVRQRWMLNQSFLKLVQRPETRKKSEAVAPSRLSLLPNVGLPLPTCCAA